MNKTYITLIMVCMNISNFAAFEPLTNLGRNILQSSEIAANDLASRTIDAAKFTKNRTEEFLHHPAPAALESPSKENVTPMINRHHPHLRNVTNTYTQVR